MRNIWELPTPTLLTEWLDKCDFLNPKVVDINTTSIEEQRTTEWMMFESLENFLDSSDSDKTIEGYPAPTRIIMTAQAPH
jgi:tRNA (mo5U34)-methyltransferase